MEPEGHGLIKKRRPLAQWQTNERAKVIMTDNVLNRLSDDWKGLREIVVYGYGKVAQRNIGKLYRDFTIKYIVDNGADKANQQFQGIPVQPFADVKDKIAQYKNRLYKFLGLCKHPKRFAVHRGEGIRRLCSAGRLYA